MWSAFWERRQFTLLGVVPGDVEGAVKEVALRMTRAAEEDAKFRELLAGLGAERGVIYGEGDGRPERLTVARAGARERSFVMLTKKTTN